MTDSLLVETAERVFSDTATFEVVQAAERDGWAPAVWDAAGSIGLPWIGVPEEAGGAGGTLEDAIAVLVVAGRHACPIPLAETGILAGWLLASTGLRVGSEPLTVVPGHGDDDLILDGDHLCGTAHRVPWARAAECIVAIVDDQVVRVSSAAADIDDVRNVAGEPRETVSFHRVAVEEIRPLPVGIDADGLRFRGALARAALMAGALTAMAELTAAYTMERRQFGKPVGTFQAVQAHVVTAAEEAALVDLAVQVAAREAARTPARFEIGAAKAVAAAAAHNATRAAHQAHGAIGMTQEYSLHHLSRRLWAWRSEFGDASWTRRLGTAAAMHGPDRLYHVIADGSRSGVVL
jgi:acyl-CoA dehydrogenase